MNKANETFVQEILTDLKLTNRNDALRNITKRIKKILPFVTTHNTYNPATPNLKKKTIRKKIELLATDSYGKYRREKSIK